MQKNVDRLITPNEAANILGVGPKCVRHYLRESVIYGDKSSGHWLISEFEVMKFAKERKANALQHSLKTSRKQIANNDFPLDNLAEAANELRQFYGDQGLTSRIASLEAAFGMRSREECIQLLSEQNIGEETLNSALLFKAVASQINVVIHSVGILLSLPYILQPGERVKYMSLGAGNAGKKFDLETDMRVAEFKFTHWRGGSDAIRENQLFKDFFYLAELEDDRHRCLYVLNKHYPIKFLNGKRALNSVLSKNQTVRNDMRSKYSDRYLTVGEYYRDVKHRVEIIDLECVVPLFGKE